MAFLLAAMSAHAADWPAWGGSDPGRNMVSVEKGLPDTFKPGEKSTTGHGMMPGTTENVRWVEKLGNLICGNPTVANGRVFVGTDDANLQGDTRLKRTKGGMVWCLDEKTGETLWRLPVPARPKDGCQRTRTTASRTSARAPRPQSPGIASMWSPTRARSCAST